MKDKLRRAGWAFLAGLFLFTGVGIGVWAFWVNTHPPKANQTNQSACAAPTLSQSDKGAGKLAGTKLSNFTPVAHVNSLQKIDTKVGSGATAAASSNVTVVYTGAIACDGIVFESSSDSGQPASFPLSGVIPGWQQGIPGMKVGGIRRLMIPSSLAYGPQANAKIPANSDLVFDVTLLAVK